MEYERIVSGRFVERHNRFVATVEIEGRESLVHVKNTGRCGELFLPGSRVYLEDHRHRMGQRKLSFSLVAVEKAVEGGVLLVNTDSQAPNKVTGEALESGRLVLPGLEDPVRWVAEQRFGDSRLDFFLEDSLGRRGFMEVKGVTLEQGRQAAFPDAPTLRGRRHALELVRAAEAGFLGYILFVLQMEGMEEFRPNDAMDPAFGEALRAAARAGVGVLAYDCRVGPGTLALNRPVPVIL
jgi:sugar fermentation stimulation protein A